MKPENAPVRLTVGFAASPESLFDAWIDPEVMERWLFASGTNRIEVAKVEPRIGGSFSIVEHANGRTIDHFGKYIEVDRPRRLRFTLQVPTHFAGITLVTVDIAPNQDGCVMEFAQAGVQREVTEGNWRAMFQTLASLQLTNG